MSLVVALVVALVLAAIASPSPEVTYRIDHVTDGDTVVLRNGQKVRLVQIDTPEVSSGRRTPAVRLVVTNRAYDQSE